MSLKACSAVVYPSPPGMSLMYSSAHLNWHVRQWKELVSSKHISGNHSGDWTWCVSHVKLTVSANKLSLRSVIFSSTIPSIQPTRTPLGCHWRAHDRFYSLVYCMHLLGHYSGGKLMRYTAGAEFVDTIPGLVGWLYLPQREIPWKQVSPSV